MPCRIKYFRCFIVVFVVHFELGAQITPLPDSVVRPAELAEVIVKAYESRSKLKNIPVSIGYVGSGTLQRFQNTSIVNAVNTIPGVRMEERSPGSYRLNIRGSSARSPFGVRNVKIYYNDIPLTDPFGNSYLNQLSPANFQTIEIIKGPGSSLYGAGTGGVMLIEGIPSRREAYVSAGYTTGSYGLHNVSGRYHAPSKNFVSDLVVQYQHSNGYRVQSGLDRSSAVWSTLIQPDSLRTVRTIVLFGDLKYETPGALTLSEFVADPRRARPSGGGFPGAVEARAAIRQRMVLAGTSYTQQLSSSLQLKALGYGNLFELRNPNIRAYEKSLLPHFGSRVLLNYSHDLGTSFLRLTLGGEAQRGNAEVNVFKSISGRPDSLRTTDDVEVGQSTVFFQAIVELPWRWSLTTGVSLNNSSLHFIRYTPASLGEQQRKFSQYWQPRIALSKEWKRITAYVNFATGFSPPTTAELLPSGGSINIDLNAEKGYNYETGIRYSINTKLWVDANAYFFNLKNTIVQRRTAGGGDYFVNSGTVHQTGLEFQLNYSPLVNLSSSVSDSRLWLSYANQVYRYKRFQQTDIDYSGKKLPGICPNTLSAGIDLLVSKRIVLFVTDFYSDRIPLNDANTAYADVYHLLNGKLQYTFLTRSVVSCTIMAGVDNLLNKVNSLGNDINGFGGRVYNAAPDRTFYIGANLYLRTKKISKP